jgi:glycosyltransferase involved in cell wall biosynthesis
VSVVIPAFNAEETIARCVEGVLAQDYPRLELVVVDDGSTDGTCEQASRHGATVLRIQQNSGTAAARNLGAGRTRSEVLVFIDADVVIPEGSLRRMVGQLLSLRDVLGVGATYSENSAGMNFISDYKNLDLVYRDILNPARIKYLATFFFALRRSDFQRAGGFSTAFPGSSVEDMEFCFRLCQGRRAILMDKQIKVDHLKRYTLGSMLRTNFWRLFNMIRIRKMSRGRYPAGTEKSPVYFFNLAAPWLLLLSAGAWVLAASPWPPLVVAGAMVLANAGFLRFLQQRRGAWFALRALPVFFGEYLLAGVSLAASVGYFALRGAPGAA